MFLRFNTEPVYSFFAVEQFCDQERQATFKIQQDPEIMANFIVIKNEKQLKMLRVLTQSDKVLC